MLPNWIHQLNVVDQTTWTESLNEMPLDRSAWIEAVATTFSKNAPRWWWFTHENHTKSWQVWSWFVCWAWNIWAHEEQSSTMELHRQRLGNLIKLGQMRWRKHLGLIWNGNESPSWNPLQPESLYSLPNPQIRDGIMGLLLRSGDPSHPWWVLLNQWAVGCVVINQGGRVNQEQWKFWLQTKKIQNIDPTLMGPGWMSSNLGRTLYRDYAEAWLALWQEANQFQKEEAWNVMRRWSAPTWDIEDPKVDAMSVKLFKLDPRIMTSWAQQWGMAEEDVLGVLGASHEDKDLLLGRQSLSSQNVSHENEAEEETSGDSVDDLLANL